MARTSKRAMRKDLKDLQLQTANVIAETGAIWKVGIYARLSVDSHSQKNESINTQIDIAKEYISRFHNMELIEYYIDLGKTGTNFERKGFECLMEDIRRQKINCVVVKDFSRFGRNYIETGNYVEKIFPFMKIRFVAVTDNYDSGLNTADNNQMAMNLKNIVNELYALDIAERVKNSKKMKREMGSYTGGTAPYGYHVQKQSKKHILIPDDATKDVVKRIFHLFVNGSTYKEIAAELYQRRIQPPKTYLNTKQIVGEKDDPVQQWSITTLKSILTNPVYIGTLLQGRTCGRDYKAHKLHNVNKEDITIVENAHEPLVSEDIFHMAIKRFDYQSRFSNRNGFSKTVPMKEDWSRGIIYCGECGARIQRNASISRLSSGDMVRRFYFFCPNRQLIDDRNCKCQGISEQTLAKIIESVLNKEIQLYGLKANDYCQINNAVFEKKKNIIKNKKKKNLNYLEELSLKNSEWYLQYRQGKITREVFSKIKMEAEQENIKCQGEISEYEKQLNEIEKEAKKVNHLIRAFIKLKDEVVFDKGLVQSLIRRIYIYSGHKVEVIFNYKLNEIFWEKGDNNEIWEV